MLAGDATFALVKEAALDDYAPVTRVPDAAALAASPDPLLVLADRNALADAAGTLPRRTWWPPLVVLCGDDTDGACPGTNSTVNLAVEDAPARLRAIAEYWTAINTGPDSTQGA